MPTTTPTPTSPTPTPSPSGLLGRYLTHPGATTSRLLHEIANVLAVLGTHLGPPVAAVLLMVVVVVVVSRRRAAAALASGARQVTVLAPPEVDPDGASVLWSNLVALLRPAWRRATGGQPHLGFEVTAGPGGLGVSLWVPACVPPGLVERSVEAAWPGAQTTTAPAVAPLPAGVAATGGELRLAAGDHYPLKTDHRVDPLRPLLGALSGLGEHEQACVQLLGRPVTGRRLRGLSKAAVQRRNGRPAKRIGRLLDLAAPGAGAPRAQRAEVDPARGPDVAAILDKAAQPCWAVTIRYAVTTDEPGPAAKTALRGRAHAVASAFAVYAGRNHLDRHRLRHPDRALAARRLGRGSLVSVAELAALAHLPTDVTVAGLARAGAKAVAPPPAVAQLTRPAQPAHSSASAGTGQGRRPRRSASLKVLGDAESASRRPVALAPADARHHLHVMGATGSGKSTLLVNLILGDIEAGRGAVVIDPKGDLVTDLCDRLPAGAETKTVLIDPAERDAPPVLNVLAGPDPDLVVDNLVGIFRNIFAAYWGPRTDDVLRAACLTLPSGSVVAGSFAAGVLSAVALGRLRRRHAYRYRPPEPGRNLGPGPLRPTLRHLGVAAMTTNGHRPPGPGEVPAMADDDPEHRERPDLVEIGTHDGQPVTLALSELAGVTVVGTTAAQMVAAWVTALMARAGPRAAEVLATRPALDVMFGPGGCPETVPGLWVLDNPGRVLGLLERTALTRARQLAEAEMPDVVAYRQANPWEPVPMVLAIVDHLPDGDAGRWGATTTKGPRLGFVAVSLDPNAPMPGRLTVGEDRVVTAAVPDWLAGRLVGVELFGLTAGDAADVIATLAESEERPDSTDGDTDDFMTADREDPGETAWPTLTAAPEDRREAPSASTEAAETGPVEPDGPDVASVVVTVFGPYEIAVDGEVVSRGLRTVAKELLAWLCLRPEGASVEAAVDALWPDTERAQVHKAFWLAASNLRTRLGATGETDSKVLVQSGDVYRLDPAAVDCDLWAFQQALAAAARAEGDRPARDALRRAVDAYRGDLLVGTDYAWVEPVRQDLHRRALDAHLRLAELDARLGNPDSATDTLRRAIDLDRYAEEPYRRLMALQADQGRLDALADTWRRLNDRLAEIDVDPEPATEHLYHSLTHPPETPADRARRARLSS